MSNVRDAAHPMRETVEAELVAATCTNCHDEMLIVRGGEGIGDCENCGFSAFVEVSR